MLTVEQLIDEAEIRNVHLRYCRGVDRMDWDLVRSCYHPDATDDHGTFSGPLDDFIAWVAAGLPRFESTTHFTGNQLVEVTGDSAWAEHYGLIFHRRAATDGEPAADMIVNVRYVDRMERRDGEWRIAKRVVLVDSDKVETIERTWITANVPAAAIGGIIPICAEPALLPSHGIFQGGLAERHIRSA